MSRVLSLANGRDGDREAGGAGVDGPRFSVI